MQAFKGKILSALLAVTCLLPVQRAHAELIATGGETKIIYLEPLRTGISAITLAWEIDHPTKDRVAALQAGLLSVAFGGTSSRSPTKVFEFLELKGVTQNVSISDRHLMLTVSAPEGVFPETLIHLENLLLEPEYSSGWYARALQRLSPVKSIVTRRPEDVLYEVADFLTYEPDDAEIDGTDGVFRFGRPKQAILRSGDPEVERRTERLIEKLPNARTAWKLPFSDWAETLTGTGAKPMALPTGTIHFADPSSTEMLILLVKAEEFDDEKAQIGTHLLVDYVGANQGSEMFEIIRQEMRAAYDPRSDFIVLRKNNAIISLSATVEALKWPEIYDKISEIYKTARAGNVDQRGLEIQLDRLNRAYYGDFFSDPVWGAQQYLFEYPKGVDGAFNFPLFEAAETASPVEIAANSGRHLPPLDDFLLVLIGGGEGPTDELKSNGYCAQPKNAPLSFCLDALSNAQN